MENGNAEFEKHYNKALRLLAYRPRSEKEIRDKLKQSFFAKASEGKEKKNLEETIDLVIIKLKEKKFLNDEEFAKSWIQSRLKFRPRSINLIKRELLQKGIDKEIIDEQISQPKAGPPLAESELENAKKIVRKKLPRYKHLPKQEIYQKLSSFLARKGFDWETIKQAIDPIDRG